jgi:hypothetical protein
MGRLPMRLLGLFLLTTSLSVASCQAFVGTLTHLEAPTEAHETQSGQ